MIYGGSDKTLLNTNTETIDAEKCYTFINIHIQLDSFNTFNNNWLSRTLLWLGFLFQLEFSIQSTDIHVRYGTYSSPNGSLNMFLIRSVHNKA